MFTASSAQATTKINIELLKLRTSRLQLILSHAFNSYNYIGTKQNGGLISAHRDLQDEIKRCLVKLNDQVERLEQALIAYQQQHNVFLHAKLKPSWDNCQRQAETNSSALTRMVEKLEPALEEADKVLLELILTDIESCFKSSQDLTLEERKDLIREHLLLTALDELAKAIKDKQLKVPSCFISYSWGNLVNVSKVHRLAEHLLRAGIEVKLDIWHNQAGSVAVFVDLINRVDFVLVMGSPDMVEKWENYSSEGKTRQRTDEQYEGNVVAREIERIDGRLTSKSLSKSHVINVLLAGEHDISFPGPVRGNASSDFDIRSAGYNFYQSPLFNILKQLFKGAAMISELTSLEQKLQQQYDYLAGLDDEQELVHLSKSIASVASSAATKDSIISNLQRPLAKLGDESIAQAVSAQTNVSQMKFFPSSPSSPISSTDVQRIFTKFMDDEYIKSEQELYIPVEGVEGAFMGLSAASQKTFDIYEELVGNKKFLDLANKRKVLLLLGEGGTGKSMFCQRLALELGKVWQSDKPIPLYIQLASLQDPLHTAIEECLKDQYNFTPGQIDWLKKNQQFIFILDGYDEIKQTGFNNLFLTNKLSQWKAKVIISCRTSHLKNDANYATHFMPYSPTGPQRDFLKEITVAPFNANQIEQYINRYLQVKAEELQDYEPAWHDAKTYLDYLQKIPGLSELAKSPFLLRITMEVLHDIASDYEDKTNDEQIYYTKRDLLNKYLERWFEREAGKLMFKNQLPDDKDMFLEYRRFCQDLASKMGLDDLHTVIYPWSVMAKDEQEKAKVAAHNNKYGYFFSDGDEFRELLRKGSPLRKPGRYQYAFLHDEIQAYFNAGYNYDQVDDMPDEQVASASSSTTQRPG